MTTIGRVRLGALTLAALSTISLAARAQDAPPPADNAAPSVTPGGAPATTRRPAPRRATPGPGQQGYPPAGQQGYPPPGQQGYPPPGQGYPPGYAPPGYAPGYAPPRYPPGYAPPGYAPPAPTEPTHSGVYVHLHLGGGFTSIKGSDGSGSTLTVSGGGPSFAVAVGGAVAPNLALFGTLFFTGSSQPKVSSNNSYYGNTTPSPSATPWSGVSAAASCTTSCPPTSTSPAPWPR